MACQCLATKPPEVRSSTPGLSSLSVHAAQLIAYSEINKSGKHREFTGVLFNLWLLANAGFRYAQYQSLLEPLLTNGIMLYVVVGH